MGDREFGSWWSVTSDLKNSHPVLAVAVNDNVV